MEQLAVWIDQTLRSLVGWMVLFAIVTAFELVASRNGKRSISLLGLSFWIAWVPVTIGINLAVQSGRDLLGIEPLITLPTDLGFSGIAAVATASLVTAFGGDLIFYLIHRAQHRWFWRFHAVHHSISDLNAINSYHHLSEEAVRAVLTVAPMSLIIADTSNALPMLTILLWLQSIYIHSNVRYNFGPLRCVLLDNCFHRIHHSVDPRHFDTNFGAFTTVWDRLFGTAYMPSKGEWPATGIVEAAQPSSLIEWIDLPFRIRRAPAD